MSYMSMVYIHHLDGTVDIDYLDGKCPFAKGAVVQIGRPNFNKFHLHVLDNVTSAMGVDQVHVRELSLLDSMKMRLHWLGTRARIAVGM